MKIILDPKDRAIRDVSRRDFCVEIIDQAVVMVETVCETVILVCHVYPNDAEFIERFIKEVERVRNINVKKESSKNIGTSGIGLEIIFVISRT